MQVRETYTDRKIEITLTEIEAEWLRALLCRIETPHGLSAPHAGWNFLMNLNEKMRGMGVKFSTDLCEILRFSPRK